MDISANWPPSANTPDPGITGYQVQWFSGATPGPTGTPIGGALLVPRLSPDPATYTSLFSTANPGVTLTPGSYFSGVNAQNTTDGLISAVTYGNVVVVAQQSPAAPATVADTLIP